MYLSLPAWEDLLESYPDIKTKLYDVTTQMVKDAQHLYVYTCNATNTLPT